MNEIQQYDALLHNEDAEKIEYSISANYVKNLDAVFGIKEFIANFYDVNKRDFRMTYQNQTLILEDDNEGIDIRYMIIGNSGSREFSDKIGEHGEGFKIGALTLVRLGYKVLIETVGYTIAFGIEKSDFLQSEVMFARYLSNDRKKGTKLTTECTAQTFKKAKAMFLHLSDFNEVTRNIIEMDTKLKNIYLNGLSHTSKNALFGYNIFEKNLVSNRDRNFISFPVLKQQLLDIYNDLQDEKAIGIVMNKMMEHKDTFHSTLEAKIIDELEFSDYQKALYRKHLNPTACYYRTGMKVADANTQNELIEVDDRLYIFLDYIGAKIIRNGSITGKKEGVLHIYPFDKSLLPQQSELELNTHKKLSPYWIKTETDKLTIELKRRYGSSLVPDEKELDILLTQHKVTAKLTQTVKYNDFKPLLNNLILLVFYDFHVTLYHDGHRYFFQKEGVNNHLSVYVYKQPVESKNSCVTIEKALGFKNGAKEEETQFVYSGCLKVRKINALYSYQQQNHSMRESAVLIEKQLKTKPKTFIQGYLKRLNENLYEHGILFEVGEKAKKIFQDVYEELYSRHVIPTTDAHNDIVKNQFGYRLLKVPSHEAKIVLLEKVGVKDATQVFMEKQKEDIHVIPHTRAIKQAIELFKEMTSSDADVYLTPILPNNVESMNQNKNIYISQEAPQVPVYLAGLIAYEHAQVANGLTKVTHEMQSHLTHYILG